MKTRTDYRLVFVNHVPANTEPFGQGPQEYNPWSVLKYHGKWCSMRNAKILFYRDCDCKEWFDYLKRQLKKSANGAGAKRP